MRAVESANENLAEMLSSPFETFFQVVHRSLDLTSLLVQLLLQLDQILPKTDERRNKYGSESEEHQKPTDGHRMSQATNMKPSGVQFPDE